MGFTLAEVLITLGIIGIVAAMTLPSLINRANEKEWHSAYKKAYSGISQAFLRMQNEGEVIDMTSYIDGMGVPRTDAVGENFKTLSKYFKTVKTCFNDNAEECWVCEKGQAGYWRGSAPLWLGCYKDSYAFVDASGMAWHLYHNDEYPILIDVNGAKNPNKLGKDRYVLKFGQNNSNSTYMQSPNIIIPMDDIIEKERWCPDGHCYYKSLLLD